ncbi:hypothetical protein ONZ51_g10646 [Trametes cubensis]|uniref:Uncharacterized protein n=1 Tax=Trametes cubensis TaxID=1111947 RepID=A0AAD7X6H8_9APHY|nr:hypothetical protein ONZ51_g10646 [Trametes cubensis]
MALLPAYKDFSGRSRPPNAPSGRFKTSLRLPLLGKFSSLPIGRGCIAQLYQPETVTPENIAYTVTLLRNLLSASDSWEENDGDFEGEGFYDAVVRLFKDDEDRDGEWARESLVLWDT